MNSRRGFSLIELMITVAIVGMLASMAIPLFSRYADKAKAAEAKSNLSGIHASMTAYSATRFNIVIYTTPLNPVNGKKKSWDPELHTNVEVWAGGPHNPVFNPAFATIGFVPSGDVYFHYGCGSWFGGLMKYNHQVLCEAHTDLDGDGFPQVWMVTWRGSNNSLPNFWTNLSGNVTPGFWGGPYPTKGEEL